MNETIKNEFRSNSNALCFIKMKNGMEILAELFAIKKHERDPVQEVRLFRPLVISIGFDPEMNMPKVVTFPLISPMITEEESCVINKNDVLFIVASVIDMAKEIYYKNWEQLLDETYIYDDEDEEMTDEQMESLPKIEETESKTESAPKAKDEPKEFPSVMYEGKKRILN